MKCVKKRNRTFIQLGAGISFILLLGSCGKDHTKHLLLNKVWEVNDVTPPEGTFDIDATNEAQDLKNGFYRHATFEFFDNGIFRTDFGGQLDSGNFKIGPYGKVVSLYQLHAKKMYEQIEIQELTKNELAFNTLISNFSMTLHLHNISDSTINKQ
jgi:hypothetical protein